ncbi:MAG: flavodoxin domain-containing protein [Lachnospiraceae bacterium]|nr:flavodoxin domain-containing protein [Lachnospiraceae bacterium]
MNNLIIYGSQYGTTKCYAEKLAEKTGIRVISYEDIKDISDYDTIIHLGGLYAGGVKGLKNTIKGLPPTANIMIVSVGLADINDKENTDSIRQSIRRQVPTEIYNRATIFHLRGGIDYKQLSFKHKTMMSLLYNKAKNLPEDKKTAEVRAMIDTFNKKVDFMDYDCLNQIIEVIE